MSERLLTIGELARRAGVATSALRYWEELGRLPAPARISGQRRYPESAAALVGVILLLRDVGFSLSKSSSMLLLFVFFAAICWLPIALLWTVAYLAMRRRWVVANEATKIAV
jgi:hypothetical protein